MVAKESRVRKALQQSDSRKEFWGLMDLFRIDCDGGSVSSEFSSYVETTFRKYMKHRPLKHT